MPILKKILLTAAGVAAAGLLMNYGGSLPVVKQAKAGFRG